ncbi:hypothetical protein BGC31_02490 [Komagataeibacter xylinus]|nr:hypothetical protein BFX83_12695 [Komagataeibacter xylinus]RFP02164.1 hypothetical protein BGC31_02490 [Komagataeibacter xylinus]
MAGFFVFACGGVSCLRRHGMIIPVPFPVRGIGTICRAAHAPVWNTSPTACMMVAMRGQGHVATWYKRPILPVHEVFGAEGA